MHGARSEYILFFTFPPQSMTDDAVDSAAARSRPSAPPCPTVLRLGADRRALAGAGDLRPGGPGNGPLARHSRPAPVDDGRVVRGGGARALLGGNALAAALLPYLGGDRRRDGCRTLRSSLLGRRCLVRARARPRPNAADVRGRFRFGGVHPFGRAAGATPGLARRADDAGADPGAGDGASACAAAASPARRPRPLPGWRYRAAGARRARGTAAYHGAARASVLVANGRVFLAGAGRRGYLRAPRAVPHRSRLRRGICRQRGRRDRHPCAARPADLHTAGRATATR